MDCKVAAVTVRVVDPTTLREVALIVVVPIRKAFASPRALMVAVVVLDETHTAVLVRFCVVPSLNVPVAVNCCVRPAGTLGFAGVTAIDCRAAAVTVNVVDPATFPDVAVIAVVPVPTPVATPAAVIVATVGVPDDQVTLVEIFCVVPSLNIPVATNCWLKPLAREGFAGVTAMVSRIAELTVRFVEPTVFPEVAVIVVVPACSALASPAALMVAVVALEEAHVAVVVRFCSVPSLKVPVATNCCVSPAAMVVFAGVSAIDCRVAAVTVRFVEPTTFPEVARIVVVPAPTPVRSPELLIVATEVISEAHTALPVRSSIDPSLKIPVAVNCCVVPFGIVVFAGVTIIDDSVGAVPEVTVAVVEPQTEPAQAVMVVVPGVIPKTAPPNVHPFVTLATPAFELAQVTEFIICVRPPTKVPVATSCCAAPV